MTSGVEYPSPTLTVHRRVSAAGHDAGTTDPDAAPPRCPQRLPGRGVERHEIVRRAAGEHDVPRGAEHTGANVGLPLVAPLHLAGLVVDCLEHRFGVAAAVGAAPALRVVARIVDVIHAVG